MRQDSFRLFQSHISCYIPLLNGNINLRAFFSRNLEFRTTANTVTLISSREFYEFVSFFI